MNVILFVGILIEIFLQNKLEEWKNDILSDLFGFSIEIFLAFLVDDFNMLYNLCLVRSIDDLALI